MGKDDRPSRRGDEHLKESSLGLLSDWQAEQSPASARQNKAMASDYKTTELDVKGVKIDNAPDSPGDEATGPIQAKPQRTWQSYVWDSLDKSPEERRFLFKLDAAVLTFASLGYFIKYLDQININNAFVSGMKEDLGLYKNQLNYMQTCWTVGYVIGEIPVSHQYDMSSRCLASDYDQSNMILTRVRPSIWIPTAELVWTILTFCTSKCNSASSIYALRFLVGLTESTFYPGMVYVIGSWYRRDELAKRSCIFHTSSAIGSMFSGYLMAGVYHLGGKGGLKG